MKSNEWGVKPGTQDNLLPEDAPMLSESECTVINLYRSFPKPMGKVVIKAMFELAMQVHEER